MANNDAYFLARDRHILLWIHRMGMQFHFRTDVIGGTLASSSRFFHSQNYPETIIPMTTAKTISASASEAEIDAAVATECGYEQLSETWFRTKVSDNQPEPNPIIFKAALPHYSTDAREAVKLLGQDYDIKARGGQFNVTIYRPSYQCDIYGPNLERTICLCFLRSNGWVVEEK